MSEILNNLKRSISRNRLSHAYLFIGEKGSGKLDTALTFAKLLYCKGEDAPCNSCPSCKQIDSYMHPNVIYIKPDGQNIKKEQIDRLQSEFSKTSLVDGYRVYIIDCADKMNLASANRLLKFIEEPINQNTIGILISENYSKVLPTIISRCQVLLFPNLKKELVEKKLLEKGYDPKLAHILPYVTANAVEAEKYIEENNISLIIDVIEKIGRTMISSESMTLYFNSQMDVLYQSQASANLFIKLLITYFMDILYLKIGSENVAFLDEMNILKRIEKKSKEEVLVKAVDILLDCSCKMNYNVNQALLIKRALLEIERG